MDLGTFKTSVASSNGEREVMFSAVGWPKDHVARTMFGRDVVFGADILQQRLALDVVRPFAKGVLKFQDHADAGMSEEQARRHKEAAKLLVQYAVSRVHPPDDAAVFGVIGAPSRASIESKQFLLDAAREAFDAVVIVPEPFTVAYGMGQLNETLIVDIGAGTIDICPMYGAYPTPNDQLTILTGGDAVDEKLQQLIQAAYPDASLSSNMARQIKEKSGFVDDPGERVTATLPVSGQPTELDVTEPLRQACETIVPPIIDGIRELIAGFDPEFQRPLLDNILLSGGGSQLKGLDQRIEGALAPCGGGNVTRVYDVVFAGAAGALKLAMNLPTEQWQRISELDHERAAAEREPLKKAA